LGLVERKTLLKLFRSVRRRLKAPKLGDNYSEWREAQWAPASADTCNYRFLALQPIFNRRRKLFGYEALHRSDWNNCFSGDPDAATQAMIDNWLLHGLDELTGNSRTFINCTGEALTQQALTLLPNRVVLELLETVEPSIEILSACRRLKALGYQIALDDFQLAEKMDPLLALADYIKVDFRLSDAKQRREISHRLEGRSAVLIAEKIETEEEFTIALSEGFHLFQGYHLGRPALFSKQRIPPMEMNHFRSRLPSQTGRPAAVFSTGHGMA
jgi:EAL and modified HD-GYP domain-containing signal transduction protein